MNMIPLETTETTEQKLERLEQRVTNLEVALHMALCLNNELTPPAFQQGMNNILQDHFEVSQKLGGCRRTHFDIKG